MKDKLRLLLLLAIDVAMIALEWPTLADAWKSSGVWMLRYYTQSSNVLALLTCTLCAATEIICLVRGQALPGWAQMLRYVSACCLMVTLIVAACILVPTDPGESFRSFMLEGTLLYLHTLCPLVMLAGCLLSGGPKLTAAHALIPLIPTLTYGVITLVMNARKVYSGPYFFFRIHQQPWYMTVMWFAIIIAGNYAIAFLLSKLKNLIR